MENISGKILCIIGVVIAVLLGMAPSAAATTNSGGPPPSPAVTRIPNSVVPVVATDQLPQFSTSNTRNQPLTLTITLNRNDQSGFDSFLSEVQDRRPRNIAFPDSNRACQPIRDQPSPDTQPVLKLADEPGFQR